MPSELKRLQHSFTAHLRDPERHPVPAGMHPRRMEVYRDLIFNNVASMLSELFPVLHGVLSDAAWRRLVRHFFVTHSAATPYFPKLAEEFVGYLSGRQLTAGEPGFLVPLAHYEWVELELFTAPDPPPARPVPAEDLGRLPLRLSPLARPLAYAWPVHLIGPDFQPDAPGAEPTCLLVLRDAKDEVHFFEIRPLAYQLLSALQEAPGLQVTDWLRARAAALGTADEARFIHQGLDMLRQLNRHRILFPHDGKAGNLQAIG